MLMGLLYSKNPTFTNDSSWASEREACILNISALQGPIPAFCLLHQRDAAEGLPFPLLNTLYFVYKTSISLSP